MDVEQRFRRQHGIITRKQARKHLTVRQIDRLVQQRIWIVEHQGVYRHHVVPTTLESRTMAAVLATNGVASHRIAAVSWKLDGVRWFTPEVSIPAHRRCRGVRGVIVHRTEQWEPNSHVVRDGIETTSIERTIMDCAGVVSAAALLRLGESAVRMNLTSWDALERFHAEHARRGRNGSAALRELLESRSGPVPLSDFSRAVAQLLTRHGLPEPAVEYRVDDEGGAFVLQADLAWPTHMVLCECDGLAHHFGRKEAVRDKAKRNRARALGWRVVEVTYDEFCDHPYTVVKNLRRVLALQPPRTAA